MNVLFVNNGSFYSGLLTEFLCFNGYTIYEAGSIERVRDTLRQKRIDLVLCYVSLDVSESLMLLAEVREFDPSLPIISLMTNSDGNQEQHIHALTPHCLIMPFKAEMLLHLIVDVTGIKKRQVSVRASNGSLNLNRAAGVN
jgi:DNA-binding NtrC family response regulator